MFGANHILVHHSFGGLKAYFQPKVNNVGVKLHVIHSHTVTPFDAPGKKPFENTVGKGEMACNEQFRLLFPQCFLPV